MSRWLDIANVYYFTPGNRRALDVKGIAVAVFNIEGEYYAIRDACPTDGGEVLDGVPSGYEIVCPRHGEHFSLKTGAMAVGSAAKKLSVFPVRVSHGLVQIEIEIPEYH